MDRIVLIHPGTTDYDQQGRIQGILDIPLTDEGRQQAVRIAGSLREQNIAAIYTSPCRAAVETGELVAAGLGIKLKCLEKMCNLDQGLWQGMEVEEVRRRNPKIYREWQEHPENVCPPRGESWNHARQRAEDAIEKLAKKHKHAVVALVAPEPLASLVRSLFVPTGAGDSRKGLSACGSWEVLETSAVHLAPAG